MDKKDSLLKKYLYRWLINIITKIVSRTSLTPNQITFISTVLWILAALLFATGQKIMILYAGVLSILSYIFDCVDGNLARMKKQSTMWGEFFDSVSDSISIIFLVFGVTFGLYKQTGEVSSWILGFTTLGVFYGYELVKEYNEEFSNKSMRQTFAGELSFISNLLSYCKIDTKKVSIGYSRSISMTLFLIAGIFNQLTFLLWFFIVTYGMLALITFIKTLKWKD